METATLTAPSRSQPGLIHVITGFVDPAGEFIVDTCDCKGWFYWGHCWHTTAARGGELGQPQVEGGQEEASADPFEQFVDAAVSTDFAAGIRGRLGAKPKVAKTKFTGATKGLKGIEGL
jgi:hypothetical protein